MRLTFDHHAYLALGNPDAVISALTDRIAAAGVSCSGNPDVSIERFETLGIDESRALKERAAMTPSIVGARKIFIVAFDFITREAQNALLKVLEEPAENTHFFLITPSRDALLPTIRSRVAELPVEVRADSSTSGAPEFLSLNPAARIKWIEPLIKEKQKGRAARLLDEVELVLHKKMPPSEGNVEVYRSLEECRSYLRTRAPSLKQILEFISITLPVIKD